MHGYKLAARRYADGNCHPAPAFLFLGGASGSPLSVITSDAITIYGIATASGCMELTDYDAAWNEKDVTKSGPMFARLEDTMPGSLIFVGREPRGQHTIAQADYFGRTDGQSRVLWDAARHDHISMKQWIEETTR